MKQFLIKYLPDFVRKFLIKQKYKKYNLLTHKKNISEGKLVNIKCQNKEKYEFLKNILKKSFGGIIKVDKYDLYFHPIAIIKKPNNINEYLKLIGAKSRNMIKKAQKNQIECKLFEWNDFLDDIYDINTSSLIRQGRKMDDAYFKYPEPIKIKNEEDFQIIHIGAFSDGKLIGYIELYVYGNFAMTNRILGHKKYLKLGIMNLLFYKTIETLIEKEIEYLNYLTMQNKENNSLSAFKYRVGFREYSLLELK